jgi:hypothetical protein
MKGSNLSKKCLDWSENEKHKENPFGIAEKINRINYT